MHTHNPNIEQVKQAFHLAQEQGLSAKARRKWEWLLHYCEHQYSAAGTCAHFGIPRMALYRVLRRFDPADPASLEDHSRRPHRLRIADTPPEVQQFVRECRARFPELGRERISGLLQEQFGVTLSPSTVARVLAREEFLQETVTVEGSQDGLIEEGNAVVQQEDVTEQHSRAEAPVIRVHLPSHWRFLLLTSFFTNLAILAFLLGATLLRAPASEVLPASLPQSTIIQSSVSLP